MGPDPGEGKTYQPVVAVFAVTLAMAITTTWVSLGSLSLIRVMELFVPES